jgi:hypothetical protein
MGSYDPLTFIASINMYNMEYILNIETFPTNLNNVYLSTPQPTNNIYGSINALPTTMTYFVMSNCTGITGSISDLWEGLISVQLIKCGDNITGDIIDVPSTLASISINETGNGIDCALSDIPTTLTMVQLADCSSSQMNMSGSLSDLHSSLIRFEYYSMPPDVITGSFSNLPSSLQYLSFQYFDGGFGEDATITGNIQDLPASIIDFNIAGLTLIRGSITTLFSTHSSLRTVQMSNISYLSGDIGDIEFSVAQSIFSAYYLPNNTFTYNGSISNWANMRVLQLRACSLSQGIIDKCLSDAVASNEWTKQMSLDGNAIPSAQGYVDKATLLNRAWTVATQDT